MHANTPYYGGQTQGSHMSVLNTVQECEALCEYTEHCVLQMKQATRRKEQLRLLRDCADICTLTAKYIARCSMFAQSTAALCAHICEICGNHCLQHPDELSQQCGRMCLHCAQQCRYFAMAG